MNSVFDNIFQSIMEENFLSDWLKKNKEKQKAEEKERKEKIKKESEERSKLVNILFKEVKKVKIPNKYKRTIDFVSMNSQNRDFIAGKEGVLELIYYDQDIQEKEYNSLLSAFTTCIRNCLKENNAQNKYKVWIDEGGIGIQGGY